MTPLGRRPASSGPSIEERGFAIAAALLAVALAGTIAAAVAEIARLEVVLARLRRAAATGVAAVDACLAHAVASLPAGWTFDDVLAGGDGMMGTADDGAVALAEGCTGAARPAPGAYEPARMLLRLEGSRGAGRRRLDAVVRRAAEPGAPAVVWAADPTSLGFVMGTLTLDGVDVAGSGPRASLAAPGDPPALDAWLAGQTGSLVVANGTLPPIWAPEPPLDALAARAAAAGAVDPAGGLVSAGPAPSHLTLASGDLVVGSPLEGAGVLVVRGVLRIEASLAFSGLVAALGGVRVGSTGSLRVDGALWVGNLSADALGVAGAAEIRASAAALAHADSLLPLPRQARVAGVQDF